MLLRKIIKDVLIDYNIKEYSEKNNINYYQVYSSYNKTKNLIKKELIKQL